MLQDTITEIENHINSLCTPHKEVRPKKTLRKRDRGGLPVRSSFTEETHPSKNEILVPLSRSHELLMGVVNKPDTPTYCICNSHSVDEMVACDGSGCKIEWFHFACVGLRKKPKGQWFCDECKKKK